MRIVFFGSTSDSVSVLDAFTANKEKRLHVHIAALVTQPEKPVGRKQVLTKTPVAVWGENHAIPVLAFRTQQGSTWNYEHEDDVINSIMTCKPDLLVSASYGQKIPFFLIKKTPLGGINVHPSLLPRWRGADPTPWTILSNDAETGVSLVTLSEQFDEGVILARKKIPVGSHDTQEDLRKKLFLLGGKLLYDILPAIESKDIKGEKQNKNHVTYARKLTRNDGFIPWEHIREALIGNDVVNNKRIGLSSYVTEPLADTVCRMIRALSPWPGVWTTVPFGGDTQKRMKILQTHRENKKLVLDMVQIEGKTPAGWTQLKNNIVFLTDNEKS